MNDSNSEAQFAYVVFLCYGEYEDKEQKMLRVFHGENAERKAKNFVEEEIKRISRMQGRLACREVLMEDWRKHNPPPILDGSEFDDWSMKRDQEEERVSALLEIDTNANFPCWYNDEFTISVQKAPCGC